MLMRDDEMPLESLANLARETMHVPCVQIWQYQWSYREIRPLAMSHDDTVSDIVTLLPQKALCAEGNTQLGAVFAKGRIFSGSTNALWNGVMEPEAIAAWTQATACQYGLAVPVILDRRVWGCILWYSRLALDDWQRPRAHSVARLLANALGDRGQINAARRQTHVHRQFELGLAEAEERLRREIAEELHGRVQTKLLLVWHELKACLPALGESSEVARRLEKVASEVETIREDDVRSLSHRLHPGTVRVAFRPALAHLAASFRAAVDVDVQVDPSFEELDQPLNNAIPELVRLTAYRVVEEALLNAVRHGKAHKVVVRVSAPGRALTFVVQDDGQGFDTKNTPRGLGLQLMQARLHAVGGNLHISSFPELGTMVRASIRLGDFTQGEISYTRGNNVPTTV